MNTTSKKDKNHSRSKSLTKQPQKSNKKTSNTRAENKTINNKQKSNIITNTKTLSRSKSADKKMPEKKLTKSKKNLTTKTKPSSSTSEITITKNVDTVRRLINNSQEVLSQQNTLLEKFQEMTKKFTVSDFEIERLFNKNENDDFPTFLEKYGNKLNQITNKLKSHTEEVEEIKYVKEENKNLKYKLELITIDKSDSGLQFEAKYNSLKNFIVNEFNNLNEYIVDSGFDYLFHKFNDLNFKEEAIAIFFQNLKKLLKNLKLSLADQENEINLIRFDKKNLINDINNLKLKYEELSKLGNNNNNDLIKKYEEDLYFYKNQVRDYERQIEEYRKFSNSNSNLNNNYNDTNYKYSRSQLQSNNRDQGDDLYLYSQQSKKYSAYDDNHNSLPNTSLENFRRNKDLRLSSQNNNLYSEENTKLENRYSDSYFYKHENTFEK